MTILAAGYGLRNLANQGMKSVAELEAQENAIADQLEAAEQAQKTQMYSTGAGIGGAYGVQKALEAGKAAKTASQGINSVAGAVEGVSANATGSTVAGLAEGAGTAAELTGGINNVASAIEATQTAGSAAEVAGGINNVANAVKAAELAEGGVAIAEGAAAAEGTTVAAGSSGGMATLGTIAAPVAIGLGVAFLLNKLFD